MHRRQALTKIAQSIVFGGGPGYDGKRGVYDLPRQGPVKTLGQIGECMSIGIPQMAESVADKLDMPKGPTKVLADVGSYTVPVFGQARLFADVAQGLETDNPWKVFGAILSTKPALKALAPKAIGFSVAAADRAKGMWGRLHDMYRRSMFARNAALQ